MRLKQYEIMQETVIQMNIKNYSELIKIPTFIERYRYLRIGSKVGIETFGYDRYLNQILYSTSEWKGFRRKIIVRDNGCDLACEGYEIFEHIIVHHINPITIEDVLRRDSKVFDPENVVSTVLRTHNAIHYGDESLLISAPIERKPNDTFEWESIRKRGLNLAYTYNNRS